MYPSFSLRRWMYDDGKQYVGAESEDRPGYIPPEEEHPVLRNLGEVELQLREALPLARQEARWVRYHVFV